MPLVAEDPRFIVRASTALLALFLCASAYSATPVSKAWQKSDATQDCGNGRRGTKCFDQANIELTWDTPTEREDATPLPFSEISHYVITMQRNGGPIVSIAVAKTNSFNLRYMPAGTYTFAIATVDSDRLRGEFSSSIQVTIN